MILEAGLHAASSVRAWGHTRLFSPWKHLVDSASRRLLEAQGWEHPDPERAPTGDELVEKYIAPLAALTSIASRLRTEVEVLGVTREGMDRTRTKARFATPFALRIRTADGVIEDVAARAVIDASGTYKSPNSLSSDGLELLGMAEIADRARLGNRIDRAVSDGRITVLDGFEIIRARRADNAVELLGHRRGHVVPHTTDVVVNATGFRPDLDMLREIRLELDGIVEAPQRLAPLIDPNVHSCGTVEPHGFRELTHPEQGFFVVGMKSYGRAPTFLLATGYEQVRSVTAWLAGDTTSAANVALVLPATGVCFTDGGGEGCCA